MVATDQSDDEPAADEHSIRDRTLNWTRKRRLQFLLLVATLGVIAIEPAAAQEFSGGAEIESFLESFIPWALRWMLVIGSMVAVAAHIFAGWTSDPDKAFRRKEWRNRAFFGVALAIPALLILNAIITTFGGEAIDFLPFV